MIQVPDGWEINNFKDLKIKLIDGDRGENYPKENEFSDNGFCVFLSAKNVTKDGFRFNEIQFIEKDKDEKLRKGKLNKNDIVLTTRGTVGNIAYFDNTIKYNHIRINSGMILLRNENKTLETNYLHIFLKSNIFDNQISNTVFGSAQPQLTVKEIEKFFICFPKEKKEQEKIAKILSTLDNAIESTSRIIEKEKNIKTALMQELLTNGIDQNGQIRTPQTHTYKQSELGLIPDEWEVVDLEKISKLITDGSHFSPEAIADSEYKIINVKDLKFDNINFQTTASITKEDYEILCNNGCSPKQNDILLSKDGTIGKVQVYLEKRQCVLLSSIAIIRLMNEFNPDFYKHYLRSFYFDTQLFGLRSGSALSRIILRDIRKLKVLFVDLEEQKQIAKILTTQDKKIEREETNLSKLKELKKGLMTDLLSGRVRVKV